jgi:hypothetical protein
MAADGLGVMVRDSGHVIALDTAAMTTATTGRPHRRKERIPPGPDKVTGRHRSCRPEGHEYMGGEWVGFPVNRRPQSLAGLFAPIAAARPRRSLPRAPEAGAHTVDALAAVIRGA